MKDRRAVLTEKDPGIASHRLVPCLLSHTTLPMPLGTKQQDALCPSLAAEAVTVLKLCSGFYNDMILKGQP